MSLAAKHMLTMTEAAEYLGVSWETLRKWASLGLNVTCYRYPKPTSPPRFRREDLDAYIESHRVEAREPRKRTQGMRRVV